MNKIVLRSSALAACLLMSAACFADDLVATITVNRTGALDSERIQLVISGTYTCGPLAQPQGPGYNWGSLGIHVLQANGRQVGESWGGVNPLCDGNPQSFQAPVLAETIPWHGGKVRVIGQLEVQRCDPGYPYSGDCEHATSEANLQVNVH